MNHFRGKLCFWILLASLACPVLWAVCAHAAGPLPGKMPLDEKGRMQVDEKDRCPVCGMRVINYIKHVCAIQLKTGETFYFCSTGCMLKSWLHPDQFLGKSSTDLYKPVVQEYFSGQQMDARKVIWVSGSDVIGPMGRMMVPLRDQNHLRSFQKTPRRHPCL